MGVPGKKTWEVESVGGGVGGRQCGELGGHHACCEVKRWIGHKSVIGLIGWQGNSCGC